jgi:hypothetical protein
MAEKYWTHCMYCHEMICGVEVLEEYPDIVVLYAHKTCHESHTHDRTITTASGREGATDVRTGVPGNAGT